MDLVGIFCTIVTNLLNIYQSNVNIDFEEDHDDLDLSGNGEWFYQKCSNLEW